MPLTVDVAAATSFVTTHGRVLDRRRLAADWTGAVAALDAYRNPDGGYGWGLEPDLRAPESQPAAAMHALEVFADAGASSPRAVELCDWLASVSLPDGGLPFALPIADGAGCAPFWAEAEHTTSALQITAGVAAQAHRVARHDPRVAAHAWLATVTDYCLGAAAAMGDSPHAYVVCFALQFLDAASDRVPEALALLDEVGRHVPPDGTLPVEGGLPDEKLRPLDYAPEPGRPVRRLVRDEVVAAELERLAALQQPDGGWPLEWASYSPAAALEWRGYLTVRAVSVLQQN